MIPAAVDALLRAAPQRIGQGRALEPLMRIPARCDQGGGCPKKCRVAGEQGIELVYLEKEDVVPHCEDTACSEAISDFQEDSPQPGEEQRLPEPRSFAQPDCALRRGKHQAKAPGPAEERHRTRPTRRRESLQEVLGEGDAVRSLPLDQGVGPGTFEVRVEFQESYGVLGMLRRSRDGEHELLRTAKSPALEI